MKIKKPGKNAPEVLRALDKASLTELYSAAINDPSDVVRHEAAFLIGQRADSANRAEALGVLNRACLADPSVLVRHEAALSLAKFPCEASIRILVNAAKDNSAEVRSSVEFALTEMLL